MIAIIAILASLLLPPLSHANFAAKNTVCKSNLRQIVLAIQMYANTHEAFPLLADVPAGQWKAQEDFAKALGLPANFITGSDVGLITYKYRRLGGVFLCPLNEGPRLTMGFGSGSGQPPGTTEEYFQRSIPTYGYGAWGIRAGPSEMPRPPLGLSGNVVSFTDIPPVQRATKESTVQVPSEMIAMGDAFNRSPNPALDGLMHWDGSIEPVTAYSSVENYDSTTKTPPKKQPNFIAHRRRANRAFVDGHIESEDMRKTFAASDAQLKRWNIDNEPHRELLRD